MCSISNRVYKRKNDELIQLLAKGEKEVYVSNFKT